MTRSSSEVVQLFRQRSLVHTGTAHGWMGSVIRVFLDVRMGGSLLVINDTATHEGRNIGDFFLIESFRYLEFLGRLSSRQLSFRNRAVFVSRSHTGRPNVAQLVTPCGVALGGPAMIPVALGTNTRTLTKGRGASVA